MRFLIYKASFLPRPRSWTHIIRHYSRCDVIPLEIHLNIHCRIYAIFHENATEPPTTQEG